MDDEGEERDEFRSSTAPNTRRRIATKTSMEENKSDVRTVAVTTQESSDGIHEKAIDELETGSSAGRRSSPGRANDRTKANELVRSLVGIIQKEGDAVVFSYCKSKHVERCGIEEMNTKLECEISTLRGVQGQC